jgi:hypothetical protein
MSGLRIRDVAAPIEAALRKAADRTGVDFGFLLKTAARESSLNPAARARGSSAAGLFQFIEQTWLAQLKQHGAKHGYGAYAQMIERGRDGRLRVPDADARRAVMDLRFDASCSSLMAGELASDHASYLKGRLGREASSGELYAAHFLGPRGAARLIEARERNPDAAATALFPEAAAANKALFFRKGRPCSVEEVYANITRAVGEASAPEAAPAPRAGPLYRLIGPGGRDAAPAAPAAPGAAYAAFSLNERLERMRQERSLVANVLSGTGDRPLNPTFSSEMLSLLAAARDDER